MQISPDILSDDAKVLCFYVHNTGVLVLFYIYDLFY